MKRLFFVIIILALTQTVFAKGFEAERAIINYKISSSDQEFMGNGTMEIAYDKFGKYMSTTTKTKEMNATTIISPEGEYLINWDDKTAMDLKSFGGGINEEAIVLEKEDEGEIIGNENIIGKNCTIHFYQDENGWEKYWLWQGIPLKVVSEIEGMKTTVEATSVSTPSSIPAAKFKVPKDVEIQKMPSFSFPLPGMN